MRKIRRYVVEAQRLARKPGVRPSPGASTDSGAPTEEDFPMRSTVRRLSLLLAGSAALIAATGGVALADPGVTPATGDIVGLGSDTSEHVLTALANTYNATGPVDRLYS